MIQQLQADQLERFRYLLKIVEKEVKYLQGTRDRLFLDATITVKWVKNLETDADKNDRLEAFVSRFNRLQDTIGDKLIPALLKLMGEKPTTAIDNYNRAEKLGWMISVDNWLKIRNLRNKLVHEYVEDEHVFSEVIQQARNFTEELIETVGLINNYANKKALL